MASVLNSWPFLVMAASDVAIFMYVVLSDNYPIIHAVFVTHWVLCLFLRLSAENREMHNYFLPIFVYTLMLGQDGKLCGLIIGSGQTANILK